MEGSFDLKTEIAYIKINTEDTVNLLIISITVICVVYILKRNRG